MPEKTNSTRSSGSSEGSGSSRVKTSHSVRGVNVVDKVPKLAEKTGSAYIRTKQNTRSVLEEDYDTMFIP